MELVSQFLFGSHLESWKRKKESVWSCLDVFFVLLRWLVHSSEGGKGGWFRPSTTSKLGEGVEKKPATFQSNTTFLSPFLFPRVVGRLSVVPFLCLLQCALVKIVTHVKESCRSSFYLPTSDYPLGREINDHR